MPASKKTQEFVSKELPYMLLRYLYKDARAPLKALGREFRISYHTISEVLKEYEEKYNIKYTLKLNERALGFASGRIITIKFTKMPDIELLKERFEKDIFVQDAYLGSGDFDLLLYVVGLTETDFDGWQVKLRMDLSNYRPILKVSSQTGYRSGFFPLRNELLKESEALSDNEKKILLLLNENSRMKLKDLTKASKLSQMRTIYLIKKLKEKKLIEGYTALVQNPDKRLFVAYAFAVVFAKEHRKLLLKFLEIITNEDLHEVANDYSLISNTNGSYDSVYLCAFADGEVEAKKGAMILNTLWATESPKVEKSILTSLLVGKWPFHLEGYENQLEDIAEIKRELHLNESV